MTRASLAGPLAPLLALLLCVPAVADSRSGGPGLDRAELDRPDAFERGFAVSFYAFDACGDPLAGRMFRRALAEKFAHCPFSPEARTRYQRRAGAQQEKARRALQGMIDGRGGLPMRLDGMAATCREQQSGDDYKVFRARLERYAQGELPAEAVLPAPCDAPDMAP